MSQFEKKSLIQIYGYPVKITRLEERVWHVYKRSCVHCKSPSNGQCINQVFYWQKLSSSHKTLRQLKTWMFANSGRLFTPVRETSTLVSFRIQNTHLPHQLKAVKLNSRSDPFTIVSRQNRTWRESKQFQDLEGKATGKVNKQHFGALSTMTILS